MVNSLFVPERSCEDLHLFRHGTARVVDEDPLVRAFEGIGPA
jgi:hypothetical protein